MSEEKIPSDQEEEAEGTKVRRHGNVSWISGKRRAAMETDEKWSGAGHAEDERLTTHWSPSRILAWFASSPLFTSPASPSQTSKDRKWGAALAQGGTLPLHQASRNIAWYERLYHHPSHCPLVVACKQFDDTAACSAVKQQLVIGL